MKLHNTLTRQTEAFKSIKPGEAKLYTCGPTVYDFAHLGNLRSFIFDDTLRRALQANGYKVKHVMNITDVGHLTSDMDEGEDKLEAGASREHKSVWEVAEFYIESFRRDMDELNVLPPNGYKGPHQPYARATDFIGGQQEIVKLLLEKSFAYKTGQAIYFDVAKLDDYGKLSGQKLSEKEIAARPEVVSDADKRNPQDFALWFFKTGRFANHSMAWGSPWGEGFPGWHLECSAIIHATLGEPVDIHTGGVDHIGTHHTNEIAQTEAAYGNKLANYWLHNEFLLVEGQRMGKSLGNFFTLGDLKQKGYDPLALRLLFLQSHYRSQTNFTWDALDGALASLTNLRAWADLSKQSTVPAMEPSAATELITGVKDAVADDLNTARALALISHFVDKSAPSEKLLGELDDLLGLKLAGRTDISADQKRDLNERSAARQHNDWAKADQIRDKLAGQGIEVSDTPAGQVWFRLKD